MKLLRLAFAAAFFAVAAACGSQMTGPDLRPSSEQRDELLLLDDSTSTTTTSTDSTDSRSGGMYGSGG